MKISFLSCLLFITTFLVAQNDFNPKHFEKMKIRNIGPAGMSGRVTAIDVDLSNTNRIYVGTASGGVWFSPNGGITWDPLFDEVPAMSIGALKINQLNPSEIWVGTGEGNPRNSHNSGAGVYRTLDGGKNWDYMGLKDTRLIHRIIIDKYDPKVVYIGAMGSAWGNSPERGVFKTTDGGLTWSKILYVNDHTGVADMVVDPSNSNKIIAAMWEFGRTPWIFNSGGKGSGMYITHDGGKNWKKLDEESGLPKGDLGRIGVAFAPSKPNIVYALVESEKNGLYKSTDGGEKWTFQTNKNSGNRPFYYSELYVDPSNENRIFSLWSYVSKSEDGGKTFKTIMDYGNNIHPDHHAFWISPEDPSYMINGNDGGMNISRDGGDTWRFITNLPVGQFYHISVDDDFPYNVYGGMQDNGSWAGPGFALKRGGIRNGDWQELYFGDGFDVQSRKDDSRYGYAMSQGGNIAMYDRVTGKVVYVKPLHPEGKELRYNWNAALALDPNNDCGVYFGSQYVHYSDDCGISWKVISDDLTTNDPEKQKQHLSGGLTIDDTEAENNTTILCISPSSLDKDILWVGTDDGNVQKSNDGGDNWTKLNNRMKDLPKEAFIPQIHLSKHNKAEAFVVANNYRRNDFKPYLYHTTDGGKSFKKIVSDLNIGGFVNAIVQDPVEENLLFLGTDVGLYVSFNKGQKWIKWGKGFPNVQIRDMVIQERFSDLVIGTFGRSIWILDDLETLRQICKSSSDLKKDFKVFDPATAYLTSRRSVDGIRFIGQAEFVGDNTMKGVKIPVWIKPKKEKDNDKPDTSSKSKKSKKEKSASVKDKKGKGKTLKYWILDSSGDTIRTLTNKKLKEGYNLVSWRMDHKGVSFPSHKEKKKDDSEPGGLPIVAGTYKAIFEFAGEKDSTEITVKRDPRSDMTDEKVRGIYETKKAFLTNVEKSTQVFEDLKSAQKTIKLVGTLLEFQEDSIQTELKDLHKDLNTQIDSLKGEYMLPEDSEGYQDDANKLSTYLWRANFYIGSSPSAPGPNAKLAIERAENKMAEIFEGSNTFFEKDWESYKARIKELDFDFFKETKSVKIE